MPSNIIREYNELYPRKELEDFVASYWENKNLTEFPQEVTICPDGYIKLIVQLKDHKIVAYFLTGIWAKEIDIIVPPGIITYGIRFKIIAPEYILQREVSSLLNTVEQLNTSFFNIRNVEFSTFSEIVDQFEYTILDRLPNADEIKPNRLRLSQFLYSTYGDIQASEVAMQIYWSQRTISRYLNKYIGISLKKYLNIQKCYRAYFQIRDGAFFPEKGFFDQAHFIREVKKHTGHTPTQLHQLQNDQFIQLKNMKKP
ncbi:AraC family transcriptional regulator [Aquimarina sp. AD10]|uniref:HTH araC/xylS-type domain-containing protein n=1 Tax=Aquimarina aggregata TaxID=1642818 RepID=A0A162XCU9_9FLAO|nr:MULTISPECIES: AraC family transcriptional regulator [Aquimarina]AXT60119.1 AraC family transcriptional regulator [Aquimarina sp. AD10]KZS38556.1 hypothetical protein AWE51_13220 [Aquimarina aggregata]RKN00088.1 AraC family transcriptional regulator [Aquimarina sp. AD10]